MSVLLIHPRATTFPPPDAQAPDEDGVVAVGVDLTAELVVDGYRHGAFPWSGTPPVVWYSPDPRLILRPQDFAASRSLRKRRGTRRIQARFDTAFAAVMASCASTSRPGQRGTWISDGMQRTWHELHAAGLAHSVEAWEGQTLVGGLYGLALGRAFFGESMFHRARDASKLALWALCERLAARSFHFIDCQQDTSHLRSLGARTVSRDDYLERLEVAVGHPHAWDASPDPG